MLLFDAVFGVQQEHSFFAMTMLEMLGLACESDSHPGLFTPTRRLRKLIGESTQNRGLE
jgi:hypothetical protein